MQISVRVIVLITIIQSSQFVTSFVVPVKMNIFVQFIHVGFTLEQKNKKRRYYIIFLNN